MGSLHHLERSSRASSLPLDLSVVSAGSGRKSVYPSKAASPAIVTYAKRRLIIEYLGRAVAGAALCFSGVYVARLEGGADQKNEPSVTDIGEVS
jgi:hypothetical protein